MQEHQLNLSLLKPFITKNSAFNKYYVSNSMVFKFKSLKEVFTFFKKISEEIKVVNELNCFHYKHFSYYDYRRDLHFKKQSIIWSYLKCYGIWLCENKLFSVYSYQLNYDILLNLTKEGLVLDDVSLLENKYYEALDKWHIIAIGETLKTLKKAIMNKTNIDILASFKDNIKIALNEIKDEVIKEYMYIYINKLLNIY